MHRSSLLSAAAILAAIAVSRAQDINVNFTGGGNGGSPAISLAPTDLAGVIPEMNFTNVTFTSGGTVANIALADGALLSVTGGGAYSSIGSSGIAPADGNEKLNTGFVFGSGTFTISNIPFAQYSLYVYELNDASGREETTTDGSTTYYGTAANPSDSGHVDQNAGTPYLYTQSISTDVNNPTPNGDYVLFSGLTGSSTTFTSFATGNGYVNGFQIVNTASVPEPTAFTALIGGVGMLLALRRRR